MCGDRSWPTWMSNHRYALHNFCSFDISSCSLASDRTNQGCKGISGKLSMVRGK